MKEFLPTEVEHDFKVAFTVVSSKINCIANEKGFWRCNRSHGEVLALIHSEVSEALEALRTKSSSTKIPGFLGVEEELADVVIRIMDYSMQYNFNLPAAILSKMKYNEGRSYKHGKEF